jgi:hypothetical protein
MELTIKGEDIYNCFKKLKTYELKDLIIYKEDEVVDLIKTPNYLYVGETELGLMKSACFDPINFTADGYNKFIPVSECNSDQHIILRDLIPDVIKKNRSSKQLLNTLDMDNCEVKYLHQLYNKLFKVGDDYRFEEQSTHYHCNNSILFKIDMGSRKMYKDYRAYYTFYLILNEKGEIKCPISDITLDVDINDCMDCPERRKFDLQKL